MRQMLTNNTGAACINTEQIAIQKISVVPSSRIKFNREMEWRSLANVDWCTLVPHLVIQFRHSYWFVLSTARPAMFGIVCSAISNTPTMTTKK